MNFLDFTGNKWTHILEFSLREKRSLPSCESRRCAHQGFSWFHGVQENNEGQRVRAKMNVFNSDKKMKNYNFFIKSI